MLAIAQHSSVEFQALLGDDPLQIALPDAGSVHDRFVHDESAAFADGAHRQLAVEGDAELAHHEDVEWCVQSLGDLTRHGDAATRQTEHDRVAVPILSEGDGEPPSCVVAVLESGCGHFVSRSFGLVSFGLVPLR